jgi:hypothetical protein
MPEIRPDLEPLVFKEFHLDINLEKLFEKCGMH